ncbi:hypothetical protein SYN60AY4M2_10530 [Synechococcus sp. 60AY4M2]|nr:hypothetical protein SYN60AY4M2_10530 [Synechococcus sp. 60AY4M2]
MRDIDGFSQSQYRPYQAIEAEINLVKSVSVLHLAIAAFCWLGKSWGLTPPCLFIVAQQLGQCLSCSAQFAGLGVVLSILGLVHHFQC